MKTLERLLAEQLLKEKVSRDIVSSEIVIHGGEPYLLVKFKVVKRSRKRTTEGKPAEEVVEKEVKKKLASFMWSDCEITSLYESYIASEMLKEGYLLLSLKGGWVVISPSGETYQLTEDTCTCNSFLYEYEEKEDCKHMVFRNWHVNYRARQAKRLQQFQLGELNLSSPLPEEPAQ